MACLYLANLAYQKTEGSPAVVMDNNGQIESISGKKLREGLSIMLTKMHQGATFDKVIADISDGMYSDTDDFTKRFIKGKYNKDRTECEEDPESLKFCVGYLKGGVKLVLSIFILLLGLFPTLFVDLFFCLCVNLFDGLFRAVVIHR